MGGQLTMIFIIWILLLLEAIERIICVRVVKRGEHIIICARVVKRGEHNDEYTLLKVYAHSFTIKTVCTGFD